MTNMPSSARNGSPILRTIFAIYCWLSTRSCVVCGDGDRSPVLLGSRGINHHAICMSFPLRKLARKFTGDKARFFDCNSDGVHTSYETNNPLYACSSSRPSQLAQQYANIDRNVKCCTVSKSTRACRRFRANSSVEPTSTSYDNICSKCVKHRNRRTHKTTAAADGRSSSPAPRSETVGLLRSY